MGRVARPAPAHYVRHNKVTRVPRTHITFDTEAEVHADGRRQVQTFRCAVVAVDRRQRSGRGWRAREVSVHKDTESLWLCVTARCDAKARTVLVAHNLAYDLRLSDAFRWLPALGWTLKAVRLDGGQAWAIWRHGDRTLVMVDSMSWLPVALDKIGEAVGVRKLDLPAWSDAIEDWVARCTRDVEILATAWCRLVDWLVADDLGNWRPTGAGQSWSAFRHRFYTHRLYVHEDGDARVAERAAAHAGRCEVWRHGRLDGGPFTEFDFTCAYARIGAECSVPVKLVGELDAPSWRKVDQLAGRGAVLCEATVTTSVPVVPCRHDGRIVWPTGTFKTTLWDRELRVAAQHGARIVVDRGWWYRTAPALHAFSSWVLDGLDGRTRDVDAVVKIALKHWGRALIGRTAAQWSVMRQVGVAPEVDVSYGRAADTESGDRFMFGQVGRQLLRWGPRTENPDAMVAVMSWVMGEARCRLWDAMRRAGAGRVVYVDTDSLIVDPRGAAALRAADIPGLRVKGAWGTVEALGPRQLVLGGELRAAGIPRRSVQVGPSTWQGDVWSELSTSMRQGEPDRVTVTSRRFHVQGVDMRREHVAGGATSAIELAGNTP